MQTPKVSIVIPSWNGKSLLAECLDSLAGQAFTDSETIVVDDGSTDATAAMVAERFPGVGLVQFPENRGFCAAVNAGIQAARGEYVFLLNNDMTLDAACLKKLIEAADATGAELLAPLIVWRDEPETIYAAGDCQHVNGRPECIGFCQPIADFAFREDVFGVCAGAGLYKRRVFDAIGLFDERFNIYFSDSDISFRARLAGCRARFVRGALACHVGSASLGGNTLKRNIQCFQNHALLVAKNMPASLLFKHAPAIWLEHIHQLRRVFSSARCDCGAVRALSVLARACGGLLPLYGHALSQRAAIQRQRCLPVKDLERLLH